MTCSGSKANLGFTSDKEVGGGGEKLQNYFKSPRKKFPLEVAMLRNKRLMTKTLWLLEIVLFYSFLAKL